MFKVIKENFVVIGKERRKREYCGNKTICISDKRSLIYSHLFLRVSRQIKRINKGL